MMNFPPTGLVMPRHFIRALGLIKAAAAATNVELGDLPQGLGAAIEKAARRGADGDSRIMPGKVAGGIDGRDPHP